MIQLVKTRLKHLHAISRWGWFVGFEAGWTIVFVNVDFIITKWGTAKQKAGWESLLHTQLGWKTWLLGVLGIALLFLIEGSYRHSRTLTEENNRIIAVIQGELNEEKANRLRPEVAVICDWKIDKEEPIPRDARALILKNLTNVAALDARVRDIVQSVGIAKFKTVSLLAGREPAKPYCQIDASKNATYAMWDLYSLIKYSCDATKKKMSEIEIAIIVDYRDSRGTWYESLNLLRYDWFLGTGEISETSFRRKP
jgi:hypothetical protein